MDEPGAVPVTVPPFVGMTVLAGRRWAGEAGVVLAPTDADGPPLGALLWPHESDYVITSQVPPPGATVGRYASVVITYEPDERGGPAGVREPRRPRPSPRSAAAQQSLPAPGVAQNGAGNHQSVRSSSAVWPNHSA